MIEWSSYSLAIFEAYEKTRNSLFIEATSGSGKTTNLVELLKRTPSTKKVLFVAFNKSIAEELKSRVPSFVECSTLHSKGLKILMSNLRFRMKLNENKTFQMAKKTLDLSEMKDKESYKYLFDLQAIWNALRLKMSKDYARAIPEICIERAIDFQDRMLEDVEDIEKEWLKRAKKISAGEFEMDFCDMLYLPVILLAETDFPKYDVIFWDEIQDGNPLQKVLVERMIKSRGRYVGAGDREQILYNFLGSDISVYNSFRDKEGTISLPLSISYRCAKSIVREAKKVFPNKIEAWENAEEGVVRKGEVSEARINDFVLCRNNKPLVEVFIQLMKLGTPAVIKGKDIGENLLSIVGKINKKEDLDEILYQKLLDLQAKGIPLKVAMNTDTYLILEEKVSILKILFNVWPTVEELSEQIQRIFSEDIKGKVVLSTIHKSKGLETDRVFFLNEELIPSDKAVTENAKYAEQCLRFVAITRARKELIYCNI